MCQYLSTSHWSSNGAVNRLQALSWRNCWTRNGDGQLGSLKHCKYYGMCFTSTGAGFCSSPVFHTCWYDTATWLMQPNLKNRWNTTHWTSSFAQVITDIVKTHLSKPNYKNHCQNISKYRDNFLWQVVCWQRSQTNSITWQHQQLYYQL